MLGYYRNTLSFIFFNEGVIVVSMLSFGIDRAWSSEGLPLDEVFDRAGFLSDLLKREETLKERI